MSESLLQRAATEVAPHETAPLQVLAVSKSGKFAVGTRSTIARAALYTVKVDKESGETKYRGCSQLAMIADAMSATFKDPATGAPVEVF